MLKALEVTGPASAPGLREDPARTQVNSLAAGTGTGSGWSGSASVVPGGGESPATGQVRGLAAAGWPTTRLDLVTLRSGLGLWRQTWTGASWPVPASLDPTPGAIQVYAARLTDDTLHTGRIVDISAP